MKDLFLAFLEEQGIKDQFFSNMRNDEEAITEEEFYELSDHYGWSMAFGGAFTWKASPEGKVYWKNINNKWVERLDSQTELY